MGLLKLADKYQVEHLEAACEKALTYTATPSYKNIKNILTTGQGKTFPSEKPSEHTQVILSIQPSNIFSVDRLVPSINEKIREPEV